MSGTGESEDATEPWSDFSSDADPAPGLLTVVWGFADDDDLGSAERLADSFGEFVLEPRHWPVGAQKRQYVLDPPNPVSRVFDVDSYGISVELPDHPVRLIVAGRRGSSPHRAGRHGWFVVPGLEHVNGLGRDDGLVAHVCVEREGHVVHVTMFPSVDDAAAVARSLVVVQPSVRR